MLDNSFRIIDLPKIVDKRGNLSIIEEMKNIPFEIKRCFWIYDVPGGEIRGGHAYRNTQEFIVALSGSFDVIIDDGKIRQTFSLNRSYYGLYVPTMMWRQMQNFSTNSLALIVTNTEFNLNDYIYDYNEFLKEKSNEK
jgi:dTDP-4-dehydrorhamnose 3,5-epimerase-like enzyme